ncbi:MAG: hypothetical protein JXB36_11085 [Gammaproteobacteria bacterium]|nr:hypothetical protein [Gammaproteobacteria bacterium]
MWIAAGFLAAFAATIATVVLTGLFVRAPGDVEGAAEDERAAAPPTDAADDVGSSSSPAGEDAPQPREEGPQAAQ